MLMIANLVLCVFLTGWCCIILLDLNQSVEFFVKCTYVFVESWSILVSVCNDVHV